MRAIILNSGVGSRMGDLTSDKPKCLIEIADGNTILDLQVRSLTANGLTPIVVTTGPFDEQLKDYVSTKFPDLDVRFVHNPDYRTTNYIYSLHLARDLTDDDLILLHGDMVYDESVLEMLIKSPHPNAVLVDSHVVPPEKDFKGRLQNGLIRRVGVDISGDDCVFLLPIYKFSAVLFRQWIREIGRFVSDGRLGVYAEDALNDILQDAFLHPVYLDGQLCMEVDDALDLEQARARVGRQQTESDTRKG